MQSATSDQAGWMTRLICLGWAHIPLCWFCCVMAHFCFASIPYMAFCDYRQEIEQVSKGSHMSLTVLSPIKTNTTNLKQNFYTYVYGLVNVGMTETIYLDIFICWCITRVLQIKIYYRNMAHMIISLALYFTTFIPDNIC